MGTRSLTHIKDEDGKTLVTIYRQMDGLSDRPRRRPTGLPERSHRCQRHRLGHAEESVERDGLPRCLPGRETLKADAGIGSIYLYPPDSSDCGEEWTYTVSWRGTSLRDVGRVDGQLWLTVEGYDGPADRFDPKAVEAALV